MTLVKICGLRDPGTALEATSAGADFVGLIFAESRRKVTPQECYDVCEAIRGVRRTPPPAILEGPQTGEVRGLSWFGAWSEAIEDALMRWRPLIVGVFADQSVGEVNEIAEAAGLDLVQLAGGEPVEFARGIERPVIRVLHVAAQTTSEELLEGLSGFPAAGVHLDTAKAGSRGGTGEQFDWEVAAEVARRLPIVLAGGLTPANVAEAVARVQPWAVDVSTGVETGGVKDIAKIRAFVAAAKGRAATPAG